MRLTYKAQDQHGKETGTVWYASTAGNSIFPKSDKEEQALKKLAAYEDAEEQGRMVVIDRETALAIAAGGRAIRTTKRFQGASYVYDLFGEDGGPYEIPYAKAGEILCNIWDKYPLDGEEAEAAQKRGQDEC